MASALMVSSTHHEKLTRGWTLSFDREQEYRCIIPAATHRLKHESPITNSDRCRVGIDNNFIVQGLVVMTVIMLIVTVQVIAM